MDAQGAIYGFTMNGGGGTGDSCSQGGCSTIFKITPAGQKTVLYTFFDGFNHKGARVSGMVLDEAGNIFGTTINGGYGNRGIVFRLAPDSTYTVLHTFNEQHLAAGLYPLGGVVFGHAGNLYGTTWQGGEIGSRCAKGCGTVYRITTQGALTTLYRFKGPPDSCFPQAAITVDAADNIYGTASGGCGLNTFGNVFRIGPDGAMAVLHKFRGGRDSAQPAAPPVMDAAGNLFGTTIYGGSHDCGWRINGPGCGLVYKIASDGTYSVLYNFKGGFSRTGDGRRRGDGRGAPSVLFLDGKGNLYAPPIRAATPAPATTRSAAARSSRSRRTGRRPCCTGFPGAAMAAFPITAWCRAEVRTATISSARPRSAPGAAACLQDQEVAV